MTVVSRRVLKWSTVFCALVLGLLAPAYGRIGETLIACERRYGPATEEGHDDVGYECVKFTKNGFTIVAHFYGGIVDSISFQKAYNLWSDAEVQTLLEDNGDGKTWGEGDGEWQWATRQATDNDDGPLLAHYYASSGKLLIVTQGHVRRFLDAKKAQASQQLDGF